MHVTDASISPMTRGGSQLPNIEPLIFTLHCALQRKSSQHKMRFSNLLPFKIGSSQESSAPPAPPGAPPVAAAPDPSGIKNAFTPINGARKSPDSDEEDENDVIKAVSSSGRLFNKAVAARASSNSRSRSHERFRGSVSLEEEMQDADSEQQTRKRKRQSRAFPSPEEGSSNAAVGDGAVHEGRAAGRKSNTPSSTPNYRHAERSKGGQFAPSVLNNDASHAQTPRSQRQSSDGAGRNSTPNHRQSKRSKGGQFAPNTASQSTSEAGTPQSKRRKLNETEHNATPQRKDSIRTDNGRFAPRSTNSSLSQPLRDITDEITSNQRAASVEADNAAATVAADASDGDESMFSPSLKSETSEETDPWRDHRRETAARSGPSAESNEHLQSARKHSMRDQSGRFKAAGAASTAPQELSTDDERPLGANKHHNQDASDRSTTTNHSPRVDDGLSSASPVNYHSTERPPTNSDPSEPCEDVSINAPLRDTPDRLVSTSRDHRQSLKGQAGYGRHADKIYPSSSDEYDPNEARADGRDDTGRFAKTNKRSASRRRPRESSNMPINHHSVRDSSGRFAPGLGGPSRQRKRRTVTETAHGHDGERVQHPSSVASSGPTSSQLDVYHSVRDSSGRFAPGPEGPSGRRKRRTLVEMAHGHDGERAQHPPSTTSSGPTPNQRDGHMIEAYTIERLLADYRSSENSPSLLGALIGAGVVGIRAGADLQRIQEALEPTPRLEWNKAFAKAKAMSSETTQPGNASRPNGPNIVSIIGRSSSPANGLRIRDLPPRRTETQGEELGARTSNTPTSHVQPPGRRPKRAARERAESHLAINPFAALDEIDRTDEDDSEGDASPEPQRLGSATDSSDAHADDTHTGGAVGSKPFVLHSDLGEDQMKSRTAGRQTTLRRSEHFGGSLSRGPRSATALSKAQHPSEPHSAEQRATFSIDKERGIDASEPNRLGESKALPATNVPADALHEELDAQPTLVANGPASSSAAATANAPHTLSNHVPHSHNHEAEVHQKTAASRSRLSDGQNPREQLYQLYGKLRKNKEPTESPAKPIVSRSPLKSPIPPHQTSSRPSTRESQLKGVMVPLPTLTDRETVINSYIASKGFVRSENDSQHSDPLSTVHASVEEHKMSSLNTHQVSATPFESGHGSPELSEESLEHSTSAGARHSPSVSPPAIDGLEKVLVSGSTRPHDQAVARNKPSVSPPAIDGLEDVESIDTEEFTQTRRPNRPTASSDKLDELESMDLDQPASTTLPWVEDERLISPPAVARQVRMEIDQSMAPVPSSASEPQTHQAENNETISTPEKRKSRHKKKNHRSAASRHPLDEPEVAQASNKAAADEAAFSTYISDTVGDRKGEWEHMTKKERKQARKAEKAAREASEQRADRGDVRIDEELELSKEERKRLRKEKRARRRAEKEAEEGGDGGETKGRERSVSVELG